MEAFFFTKHTILIICKYQRTFETLFELLMLMQYHPDIPKHLKEEKR